MVRFAPLLLLVSVTAWAQSEEKRVLLEIYTGAWCQFCTDVDWRVDALKETWGSRLVVAYDHNGDAMDFSPSPGEEVEVSGYPTGSIDRGTAESRATWEALISARMALESGASLGLLQHYDPGSRTLDVRATATFALAAAGGTQLRLELIEDDLTGTGSQWNQTNYYNAVVDHPMYGVGNPVVGYVHRRVIRATPTGIDDGGAIAAGAVVDQVETEHWQVVLPEGWEPGNMSVAAFLIDQAATAADRRIWNVVEAPLGAEAAITVSGTTDGELDFGGVPLGEHADATLTVTNSGSAPLEFGTLDALSQPEFTIVADDCSEATHVPGGECDITVRFEPTTLLAESDELSVAYVALGGGELSVHLSGIGADPGFSLAGVGGTTEEPELDLGDVRVGQHVDATITVTSNGNMPLVLGVRDAVEAPFSVIADTCSEATHAIDATCVVTVRYAPGAGDAASDGLRIPFVPSSLGEVDVALTGTGNGAPVAVADAYTVVAGEVLEVEAPGVLANDSDPDFDTILSSIDEALPGLTMGFNGSFSVPTSAEDAGTTLTFTYADEDLHGSGLPATVTITVEAPDEDDDGDDVRRCGCATATPGTAATALVGLIALLSRRRRPSPLAPRLVPPSDGL